VINAKKSQVMDYKNLTAPCGKDCFNCPLYTGEENRENRAGFLKRYNLREDQFLCKGCRNNNGYCPGLEILKIDGNCKLYACTQIKQVEYCFECSEFPCPKLQPVGDRADRVPHALKIFNLCMIQKHGLEKWATMHSKRILTDYYTKNLDSCM
jgi:hypothetical protein